MPSQRPFPLTEIPETSSQASVRTILSTLPKIRKQSAPKQQKATRPFSPVPNLKRKKPFVDRNTNNAIIELEQIKLRRLEDVLLKQVSPVSLGNRREPAQEGQAVQIKGASAVHPPIRFGPWHDESLTCRNRMLLDIVIRSFSF